MSAIYIVMGIGLSNPETKETRPTSGKLGQNKGETNDKMTTKPKFRILLLGGSECGKTTIFKQMRILHLDGFSHGDRYLYRQCILRNVIDSIANMLNACKTYRIVHENVIQEKVNKFSQFYNGLKEDAEIKVTREITDILQRIWQSNTIQLVYNRRFQFHLLDNAKYFLDSIERITAASYSPTTQDILQCRFRTTGIHEMDFVYKKLDFKMVDVGGQRTERRKWIHCFDNVNMVLFVVAMSDYDRCDPEDVTQNQMIQSQQIFKTIVQSDYFKNASIVLFLNKFDIFQEKIKHCSIKKCWPEYDGDNSTEDCAQFVKRQFHLCVPNRQKYFPFVTTATDTKNIDFVFSSAVNHIINQNLKATGLHE